MIVRVFLALLFACCSAKGTITPSATRCSQAQCEPTSCPNPIKGRCCDICLEDCRVILCARPSCSNPITPPDRCCPICPRSTLPHPLPIPTPTPIPRDCTRIQCFPPACPNPKPPGPDDCCPFCLENCAVVSCVLPDCDNPTVPPGRCCPVCPSPPPPPDCSAVLCLAPTCPNPIPPPPGECCATCKQDCRLVRCARPNCENSVIPPGQCCPICPIIEPTDICALRPDPGPCEAAIRRWFFDSSTGECRTFTYGGCRGNDNNFNALSTCLSRCKLRCPPGVPQALCAADPCSESKCSPFPDAICVSDFCGGCNARYFLSNGKEVTDRCEASTDICNLPAETGPCQGAFPRWFYNSQTKQCERFIYGGCLGNDNRFTDLQSCLSQCASKCPRGSPVVQCFADPCSVTQCSSFPSAVCVSNFCGGCNARFFLEDGSEVTDRCNKRSCPNGQIFASCGKTCNPTCEDQQLRTCIGPCISGCRCPRGTVLDRRVSKCVDSDDCGECPRGKKPVNCLVDPCTQTSCSNIPNAECLSDNCGGCFARFFVGLKEVTEQCKLTGTSCPINGQVFQQCRTCPATCENPGLICTLDCRAGCGCPPGQLIDEANNRCVPADQCPKKCSIEGQVFQRCQVCPATCTNINIPCPRICRPGCGCPLGQIIDEDQNRCVPLNECSNQKCPIQGQIFQRCKPCEVTCVDAGRLIPCPLICAPGCGCPPGTVLDEQNKKCVKQENCPPQIDCSTVLCPAVFCPNAIPPDPDNGQCCPTCPPGSRCPIRGQVFQECKSCPSTCSEPDKVCIALCQPGCGCPIGQVIDEQRQQCVPRTQCSAITGGSSRCLQPVSRGSCRNKSLRFHFNPRSGRCHPFVYRGCGGNKNNFRSRRTCERTCQQNQW